MPTKKDDTAPVALRARRGDGGDAEDEYRRLLYVAMTRAADRLVICGSDGKNKRPDGCWYNLIDRGAEGRTAPKSPPTSAAAPCSASANRAAPAETLSLFDAPPAAAPAAPSPRTG